MSSPAEGEGENRYQPQPLSEPAPASEPDPPIAEKALVPEVAPPAPIARMHPEQGTCPSCHRQWGAGIACQFCSQVDGLPAGVGLASSGQRLGAYILDAVLMVPTVLVGWLIWSLIVFKNGQTPAKQIMGMRAVTLKTGTKASWGTMFVREVIAKMVVSLVTLGIGIIWLLWDSRNQQLYDKMVGTIVVTDKHKELA